MDLTRIALLRIIGEFPTPRAELERPDVVASYNLRYPIGRFPKPLLEEALTRLVADGDAAWNGDELQMSEAGGNRHLTDRRIFPDGDVDFWGKDCPTGGWCRSALTIATRREDALRLLMDQVPLHTRGGSKPPPFEAVRLRLTRARVFYWQPLAPRWVARIRFR